MPKCNSCNEIFEDFRDLAKHIIRKRHRKGRIWASRFLMRQRQLDRKASFATDRTNFTPPTAEDRLNKQSTYRQLSGYTENAYTICPRCNRKSLYNFPVEFIESLDAWRKEDCLVKLCAGCGGE